MLRIFILIFPLDYLTVKYYVYFFKIFKFYLEEKELFS